MKKKVAGLLLCIATAAAVCACGGKAEETGAGDVAGMITQEAETGNSGEAPGESTFAYEVGTQEVDTVLGCLYGSGNMYYLVTEAGEDGNPVYQIVDESFNPVPDTKHSFAQYHGKDVVCFLDVKSDGTHRNVIIDSNLKVLLDWESKQYYIESYDDGVATFIDYKNSSESNLVMAYMDIEKGQNLMEPYKDFASYGGASYFYDGVALIRGARSDDPFMRTFLMYRDGAYEEMVMNTESGKQVPLFMSMTSGRHPYYGTEGWVLFSYPDIQAETYKLDKADSKFGFYNINTKQIVPYSSKDTNWRIIIPDGTNGYLYEYYGYAFDITASKEDDPDIKVFDIDNGKYASDITFRSFNPNGFSGKAGLALVCTKDGKWGWFDDSMKQVGEWYDDASAFIDDYAVVNKDGSEYIINSKMEILSDAIEGASASGIGETDTCVYFAIAGKGEGAKSKILKITK